MSDLAGYLTQGVVTGLVYGLLALGLVLVHKGTRVLNLAHPYLALLTAFIAWWLTARATLLPFAVGSRPRFVVAAVLSLVVIGLVGWLLDREIFRRLRRAPRLILLVATIAVGQGLLGIVVFLFEGRGDAGEFRSLPLLIDAPLATVGQFVVSGGYVQAIVLVPVVVLASAAWFRRSRFGVAVRAAADNGDAARLLGVPVDRVTTFSWIAGAVLAGLAGLLITSVRGSLDVQTLSTGFLVRALAAALIGGLSSLPGALVGGMVVGISEAMLQAFPLTNRPGAPETLMLALVIGILLVRPGGLFGQPERARAEAAFVPGLRELPLRLASTFEGRAVGWYGAALAVAIPVAIVSVAGAATVGTLTNVVVLTMVGVSLDLLLGRTGQLSLGHWALAGVGAFAFAGLSTRAGLPFALALPLTVVVGTAVAIALGFAALRIRGLYLAMVTLAFAVACELFLFRTRAVAGSTAGITVVPPSFGPLDLDARSGRPLFLFSLVLLLVVIWLARNVASTPTGRAMLALRENEKAAAALGVPIVHTRLLAFASSGGIAALAGALYAMNLGTVDGAAFPVDRSLLLVAMVMIGGLGSVSGAALGAFVVFGLPELLSGVEANRWVVSTASGLLLLVVVTRAPGGLAGLVHRVRDDVVEGLVAIRQSTTGARARPTATPPA